MADFLAAQEKRKANGEEYSSPCTLSVLAHLRHNYTNYDWTWRPFCGPNKEELLPGWGDAQVTLRAKVNMQLRQQLISAGIDPNSWGKTGRRVQQEAL
jgi:hypothetical protein